ncbi:Outer membrane protein alpha precursor [Prochlorococcus marinus str. MIT 1323]|nr:Outer membrane protein alpha precursor [Prochlorococcus marinus str. MIT 1323]
MANIQLTHCTYLCEEPNETLPAIARGTCCLGPDGFNEGVSDYSASSEQVTSISQFQDVYPTDWAYQALSNLIERYGCVAGYPSGSYLGNRAMTRFEAAALLNACLDRITEVTDELRRLLNEFEQELAILKGRVDGLEARVGELEATQFPTTTKLVGQKSLISQRLKEA